MKIGENEDNHVSNRDKLEIQRIALIRKLFNKARERREKVMEFQRMIAQRRRMKNRPLPQVPVFTTEKPIGLLSSQTSKNHQQPLILLNLQEHRDINQNNDFSQSSSEGLEDNSLSSQSSTDSVTSDSPVDNSKSRGYKDELSSEIYSKNQNSSSRQVEIIYQNTQVVFSQNNNIRQYNLNNFNYCYPSAYNNSSYFICQPVIHLNSSTSSHQYNNMSPNYHINLSQQIYH